MIDLAPNLRTMEVEQNKPDYYMIDITDPEELIYIARKLGCNVSDILAAVELHKTRNRSAIYNYIIDGIFKGHIQQN